MTLFTCHANRKSFLKAICELLHHVHLLAHQLHEHALLLPLLLFTFVPCLLLCLQPFLPLMFFCSEFFSCKANSFSRISNSRSLRRSLIWITSANTPRDFLAFLAGDGSVDGGTSCKSSSSDPEQRSMKKQLQM